MLLTGPRTEAVVRLHTPWKSMMCASPVGCSAMMLRICRQRQDEQQKQCGKHCRTLVGRLLTCASFHHDESPPEPGKILLLLAPPLFEAGIMLTCCQRNRHPIHPAR